MSSDSEDQLLADRGSDGKVILVRGSSDDVNSSDSRPMVSETTEEGTDSNEGGEDSDMITDDTDNNATPEEPVGVSSGDLNTQDLTAFEEGMKNLNVTRLDEGPTSDSGRKDVAVVDSPKSDLVQLFETCGMIHTRQKTEYPAKPPKTGLMDAMTVSILTVIRAILLVIRAK